MAAMSTNRLATLHLQYPGAQRLTLAQMAAVTGLSVHTVRKKISQRKFPIPAQRDGGARGRLYFDILDVARHLDKMAGLASRRRGRPTKAEALAREELGEAGL